MSAQMLLMRNQKGEQFAYKHAPGDPQNAWIFYDNRGAWVTLRPALPGEVERATRLVEAQKVLSGEPCQS